MARGAFIVRIDPDALTLIETCAAALGESGLDYYLDELCARGAFTESLTSRVENGVLVVSLGPFTELLLHECIDVAKRKGWPKDLRERWIAQAIKMAGFGG